MTNQEKREALRKALTAEGWTADRHGHFTKMQANGKRYRMKFGRISVRHEVRVDHSATQYSPASHSWVRKHTEFYSGLEVLWNGDVKFGVIFFQLGAIAKLGINV